MCPECLPTTGGIGSPPAGRAFWGTPSHVFFKVKSQGLKGYLFHANRKELTIKEYKSNETDRDNKVSEGWTSEDLARDSKPHRMERRRYLSSALRRGEERGCACEERRI